MINIIDYGRGNLHSVQKALERLGAEVIGCAFVVDLPELGGRKKLTAMGMEVHALCEFDGL